jgi:hypothetical protein
MRWAICLCAGSDGQVDWCRALGCVRWQLLGRVVRRVRVSPTLLLQHSGLYLWLAICLAQPHKEERFLYVVYPLIAWQAAVVVRAAWSTAAAAVTVRRPARLMLLLRRGH